MQSLADNLHAIEVAGVLAVDLSRLPANDQRVLFHDVLRCPADRLRVIQVERLARRVDAKRDPRR